MAGKVCLSYVFKKNRSSPTTSLNTKEAGERLTIGPAGRFCASQAPQLCLAAARMNLRMAPPRRNTRTSVRFDGCPKFSWIFEICLRVCKSQTRTVLFHLPWSSCVVVFWELFIFIKFLNCGWKSVGNCHLVMYVTVVCMLGAFLLVFFLVLSSRFLQHDSQILLTVPLLRTQWLSRHW